MKPLTFRTALAIGALTGWLTILGTYGCQPNAPAPTLTELMVAPLKWPASAPASTPAPTPPAPTLPPLAFGFKVGETIPYTEDLTVKTVTAAPVPLDPGATYVLSYYKGRLLKVSALSSQITGDPVGTEGKATFNDLVAVFTERYGKPFDGLQASGSTVYRRTDEFYECLAYTGCGLWMALFKTPDKTASIWLKGISRGKGYIDVTVEAAEWSGVVDQINAAKSKALANSL